MTLMTSPAPGVSAFPSADGDLLSWTATIEGPDDTPYAGLTLKLTMAFPPNYPYAPPTVAFKTPIYHPNFDFSGRICLDILKDKWTAAYNIQTVLLSLQSLLGEPNKCVPAHDPPRKPIDIMWPVTNALLLLIVPHRSTGRLPSFGIRIRQSSSGRCLPATRISRTNSLAVGSSGNFPSD